MMQVSMMQAVRNAWPVRRAWVSAVRLVLTMATGLGLGEPPLARGAPNFQIEEASITDIHKAIRRGRITCTQLIQGYVKRAQAYNGVCTKLVTADGAGVPAVPGVVRAGNPLVFPTDTVPVASILPDLDQYAGLPLELGRMEPTVSDPTVWQQQACGSESRTSGR